jgi:hypothetical protein
MTNAIVFNNFLVDLLIRRLHTAFDTQEAVRCGRAVDREVCTEAIMICIGAQAQAAQQTVPGASVECASPFLNPAHVLAPPRHWLEALVEGGMTWEFFRLRYKALLRERHREHRDAFYALLEASQGEKVLVLTCHCLAGPCHLEVAREFLEWLRERAPYQEWARLRHRLTLFPLPAEHPGLAARAG